MLASCSGVYVYVAVTVSYTSKAVLLETVVPLSCIIACCGNLPFVVNAVAVIVMDSPAATINVLVCSTPLYVILPPDPVRVMVYSDGLNFISYAVPFTSVRPPPDLVTCTSNQVGAAFDGVGCAGYQGFVTHVLASNAIHQSNGGQVCWKFPLKVVVIFKTPFVEVSNVALPTTPFPETDEHISWFPANAREIMRA